MLYGILAVFVLYGIFLYNNLIKLKNNVESAFADVDVLLKNRFNLVENLVNTIKGYTTHEKGLLENLTKSRTEYLKATENDKKMKADNDLSLTLKSLFAVTENYPDLKADAGFTALQQQLADLENNIVAGRKYYNNTVREYNTAIESFPTNQMASGFNFKKKSFYELDNQQEKGLPKVDFGVKKIETKKMTKKKK